MNIEHVKVATAYKAQVVPRNARKPREALVREEMIVGMRVVSAKEFETALTVGDRNGKVAWGGFEGSLWKPLLVGDRELMKIPTFVESVAAGASLFHREWNPFLGLGSNPVGQFDFRHARTIEEMALRRVEDDDRKDVEACATRVAERFLLLEEGAVMYRSTGPFWLCKPGAAPVIVSEPERSEVNFGVSRRREAEQFSARTWNSPAPEGVVIDIHRPDCIPDLDKMVAARAVANSSMAHMLARTAKDSPDLAGEFRTTLEAIARIYGRRPDYFMENWGDNAVCPGIDPPTDNELLSAVQGARRIALEGMGQFFPTLVASRRDGVSGQFEAMDKVIRASMMVHLDRFDRYEFDRLELDEPDLDLPSNFGAQP